MEGPTMYGRDSALLFEVRSVIGTPPLTSMDTNCADAVLAAISRNSTRILIRFCFASGAPSRTLGILLLFG